MDPAIIKVIIDLVAGAIGGNAAGATLKNYDLGTLGNSLAGIVGGGIGGQILSMVLGGAAGGGGLDIASIVQQIAGGGIGGAILMAVVGAVKNAMAK